MTASNITAAFLRDRFIEEQDYIQKYVAFVNYKTAIYRDVITKTTETLKKYSIANVREIRGLHFYGAPFTFDELKYFYDAVIPYISTIKAMITDKEKLLIENPSPNNLGRIDAREPQGECIQYMLDSLEGDMSQANIDFSRKHLIEQINTGASEDEYPYYNEEMIDYAISAAVYILHSRELHNLQEALGAINEVEIALRMSDPDAEINTLRQSFILLMTIFDATMFDITRVALKTKFFTLIGTFAKQERIPLDTLSKFVSFEELRDNTIEDQLRSKYLKEILFILNDLRVTCVDETSEYRFIHLIEMVLRRNVHIHNRGRVDEKYLERDNKGKPRYNIYNLLPGAVAHIDMPYWELANRLCRDCVILIAKWADT